MSVSVMCLWLFIVSVLCFDVLEWPLVSGYKVSFASNCNLIIYFGCWTEWYLQYEYYCVDRCILILHRDWQYV